MRRDQAAPRSFGSSNCHALITPGFSPTWRSTRTHQRSGWNFLSVFMASPFKFYLATTAYQPQTNGLTVWTNKKLVDMLSMYVLVDQANWGKILPFAIFAYTSIHSVTGFLPSTYFTPVLLPHCIPSFRTAITQIATPCSTSHCGLKKRGNCRASISYKHRMQIATIATSII